MLRLGSLQTLSKNKHLIFLILFSHAVGFSLREGVGKKKPNPMEGEDLSLQLFVMSFPALLDMSLIVLFLLKSLNVGGNRIRR